MTYYAFISYSHRDEPFARKLQHYLEHYKLPSVLCRKYPHIPRNLRPIFRDGTDLAVGQLNEILREALAASRFLIVICSENSVKPNAMGKNWIDEEIRMFLELHREGGGLQRVIPIILRDKATRAEDCLLPTLRELDILAADMQAKGEERTLNDVVAKMAGLRPDMLWDRHLREKKRQQRLRCLLGGCATLLAGAAAWWCWDYYVPHVTCYADYVERNNLPEGLFPLSEEAVKNSHRHYRFTSHKHRLRSVEQCNSVGQLQDHHSFWHEQRPARMELLYGESGHVTRCIHQNARGQELTVRKFSPGCIDYVQRVDMGDVQSEITHTAPLSMDGRNDSRSAIGRYYVERQKSGAAAGVVVRELFCKAGSLTPMKNAEGLSGREYSLDALGRPVEIRYLALHSAQALNAQVEPMETRQGIAGYRLSYHENGQIASITTINRRGEPTLSEGKWVELRNHVDIWGNSVAESYHDAQGQPCLHRDGYARVAWKYDARGFKTEDSTYNLKGEPCLDARAVATLCWQHDERGHRIEERNLNTEGKLCYNRDGVAIIRWAYDEHGRRTEQSYYGTEGQPCLSNDQGVHRFCWSYDSHGNIVEERSYGADNQLCLQPRGFARITWAYDARGNMLEETLYGRDGTPCLHRDGYARAVNQYDEHGNRIQRAYYGTGGRPCLHADGYARITWQYDEHGNLLERAYWGTDGRPCYNRDGYARIAWKYDQHGNKTDTATYDTEGYLCRNDYGCARITNTFDERGNCLEEAYYDDNNRPCARSQGFARMTSHYDASGNCVRQSFFNAEGAPCPNEKGCASIAWAYDERGNMTEERAFGVDGNPCLSTDGYAARRLQYDERGNITDVSVYGTDGELCLCAEGFAGFTRRYNERNNPVEQTTYGVDGQPCETSGGVQRVEWRYDAEDKLLETLYVNAKGDVVRKELPDAQAG